MSGYEYIGEKCEVCKYTVKITHLFTGVPM